jgi:hypothetical protein
MQTRSPFQETPAPRGPLGQAFVAGQDMHIMATGRVVDRLNPQPDFWDIHRQAPAVSKLCRYGGEMPDRDAEELGIPKGFQCMFFSVGEHQINVGDTLRKLYPRRPELWVAGYVHDLHEVLVSDLISPIKRAIKRASPEFAEFERRVDFSCGEHFGVQLSPLPPEVDEVDKRMVASEGPVLFPMSSPEHWIRKCGQPYEGIAVPNPRYIVRVRLSPEQAAVMGHEEATFTSYPPLVARDLVARVLDAQAAMRAMHA